MPSSNRIATAFAALSLAFVPVAAQAYSALYVFGDSLSDVGNDFLVTGGAEPAPPYANGQFSNGPVWAQDLSHSLGLGTLKPSLAPGGTDYAFGGATTGYPATATPASPIPTLITQLGLFAANQGGIAPSAALYAVWAGSNDLLNIISNGVPSGTPTQAAQGAAQTEAAAIGTLAAAGARDFLVPLISDLGKTPELSNLGSTASAAGTALALIYNVALQQDLASLTAIPGTALSYLDTFTLLDNTIADPAAFGLTNVTDPCYIGTYFGGGSVCANPDQYLFWDSLHPTAADHAIIAAAAVNNVPEPGTITILSAAVVGLLAATRRRSRSDPYSTH